MPELGAPVIQIGRVRLLPSGPPPAERARLEHRARLLAHTANAWHLVEAAVALVAGVVAGSVALEGFGIDSAVELLAGGVIVWLFTGGRSSSAAAERRAQQAIAASFFLLAAYVTAASVNDLAAGHHSGASWVGIGLAAFTAPTMPLLARAKRKIGHALGSSATVSEANQSQLCAYLRRTPRRPAPQRPLGPLVGRPSRRAHDRRRRSERGTQQLARPKLRLLLEQPTKRRLPSLPDTTNTHLGQAFRKLGIRSRVTLAPIAAERE